jgi:hypothetical protein
MNPLNVGCSLPDGMKKLHRLPVCVEGEAQRFFLGHRVFLGYRVGCCGAAEFPNRRHAAVLSGRDAEMRRRERPDAAYFEGGCVIDQPFQARLSEGVVRCYMVGDRCAGFGHQKVKALVEAPAARAEAGPRLYSFNGDPRFQRLRRLMEDEWTPQLTTLLDIPRRDLPMIWDADFMLGPPGADRTDSYVLGEINVSSVFPIPDQASAEIARRVADRLQSKS